MPVNNNNSEKNNHLTIVENNSSLTSDQPKELFNIAHTKEGHRLVAPAGEKHLIFKQLIFSFTSIVQTIFRNRLYPIILFIFILIWSGIDVGDIIELLKVFKDSS